jgi:Mrp family chromosome partitioning ATPase
VFRQLSVALDLCADRRVVVGVTSAIAGEGRTTCAAALARTVAEDASSPVLLVEADLQHPALASYFNLPTGPGLADVLRGSCSLPAAIQSGGENLFVVTAGTPGDDLASLMLELPNLDPVRACSWVTGAVILDLPPILNHGYSPEAARLADDVVLVARAGITPVEALREALARLGERPPVGVVLNGQTSSIPASLASLFPS